MTSENNKREPDGSKLVNDVSLFISKSKITSLANKTGSWRFARPVYLNRTAPCSVACPAGNDIPRIEMLLSRGLVKKAWEAILMENPFPSICGRVCFHNCEGACNRGPFDKGLAINRLERFIGDAALGDGWTPNLPSLPENGKKVAIVGSGPGGLSAAWFLTRLGFACEIFEAQEEPGGILRWGIPEYRLPGDILAKEIKRLVDMRVKIHCGKAVDEDFLATLKSGFDAVFMGVGLGKPICLNITGEEHIMDGLDFLAGVRRGEKAAIKGKVAVLGGGNTAVDVARSLVRLGAEPVIVYRRRREDMPAFAHEVEMALEEGVALMELLSPLKIEEESGVLRMTVANMKTGEPCLDGRMGFVRDGDKTEVLEFSRVYSGVGSKIKEPWHLSGKGSVIDLANNRFIDGETPMIYGGDLVNEDKSVTDAIASGKEAALALSIYFDKGLKNMPDILDSLRLGNGAPCSVEIYLGGERKNRDSHVVSPEDVNYDYFEKGECPGSKAICPERARECFEEIEGVLSAREAMREAQRCFNCGVCNDCDNCRIFCPEVSIYVENGERKINLDYCKGCGVCTVECPRGAMIMEEESI